jgi:hypothetical protein
MRYRVAAMIRPIAAARSWRRLVTLSFRPPPSGLALEIVLDPQMQPGVPRAQRCTVAVNGDVLATKTIRGPFRFTVSVGEWNRTVLRVSISVQDGQGRWHILLSRITLVQTRPIVLPPPFVPFTEIRFGWNDTGEEWLREGWGRPEDAYVWAIGGRSVLRLPVPPGGGPFLTLLDMKPHIQPPMTVSQRVVVQAEGADPVTIDLRERLVNAFIARPAAGQTETVMIFSNQDADFESADPLYHFGKPFAWSLFVARIMPAGPRFYPGARPPAPGSWHDGSMRQAVAALSGMSVAEIADSFIVLGNCCEFTNHQRAEGCDRASLLRLTAVPQQPVVEGLFSGFPQVGRLEHLTFRDEGVGHPHWRVIDGLYGISFATPFLTAEPFPDGELLRQSLRLPRLAEKLIEDIAQADRVIVFRIPNPGAGEPAILAVKAAIRRFSDAQLVWLVNDGSRPPGFVERLACGVLRGHIEPAEIAPIIPPQTVVSVLANALILIRQAQFLPA